MSDNERSCRRAIRSRRSGWKPHVLGPGFLCDPIERTYGSAKPPASKPIRPPSARMRQAMPMGVFGWPKAAARPSAGLRCIEECLLMADADDKKPQGGHSLN